MQASHTTFDLGGSYATNVSPLGRLRKSASKQAHHVRGIDQTIGVSRSASVFHALAEIISPCSILVTHMLVICSMILLAPFEQTFCP